MAKLSTADTKQTTKRRERHTVTVVAFVVFGISLCAFLMYSAYPYLLVHAPSPEAPYVEEIDDHTYNADPVSVGMARALPIRLSIPKLSLDVSFVPPLALNPDRTISVPDSYTEVGWYGLGAAPGEVGTAAILGHVDSKDGPAVFYSLGQLAPGDMFTIDRDDGTTAHFVVTELARYAQGAFPNETVYAPTPYPSIRLITCSGVYDRGEQRYSHNLVVFGRLVEEG